MPDAVIHALHGFLGCSRDWHAVSNQMPSSQFYCEDLFTKSDQPPPTESYTGKKIFLGYSLGGRIGLEKLKKNSLEFDHYVFLSTNPGFSENQEFEKTTRIKSDFEWCPKITDSNWQHFIKEWNSQSIFSGSVNDPVRNIEDFDLEKLKWALMERSLGVQEDFRGIIRKNSEKISWVVGSRDKKYCEIAESIGIQFEVVDSGHRILLDNPDAIVDILKKIIKR